MRMDKTHQCPIGNCPKRHGPNDFMCARHWFMVPKTLRDEVWALYRTERGSVRHRRAVLESIRQANLAHRKLQAEAQPQESASG